MATIFAHPLVPIVIRAAAGGREVPGRLLALACLASILPDADVIAFSYGISYADIMGHRGFTHSIGFALIIGLAASLFYRLLRAGPVVTFLVIAASTLSHALLDAMTNGGLGVAMFWPISETRYFLPWQPIEVSPIGIARFLSPRGADVLMSELIWIGIPAIFLSLTAMILRKQLAKIKAKPDS